MRHTRRLFKLHSRKALWGAGGDGLRAHITPPPARDNPFDWEAAAEAAARGPRGAAGAGPHEHWEQERQLPKGRYPAANRDLPVGGGVRAGAVALGVLQSLREHGIVQQARYLVSVSGGGFTAGALQQTLAAGRLEAPYGAESRPVPAAEVYAPGSVEEDHTRRHSDYLADTPRQWAVALDGLLLRLTCSLALLALASACLGLVLRGFSSASRLVRGGAVTLPPGGGTPRPTAVANLDALRPRFLAPCQEALQFRYCHVGPAVLHPRPGILLDLGALLALTAMSSWLGLRWRGLRHGFAQRVLVTAAIVAVFGVALPMAMWLGAWLPWQIGHATAGDRDRRGLRQRWRRLRRHPRGHAVAQ